MTLRELLKEKGIAYKIVSDALGIHPNNMPRYDNLMKRSVEEVITISKATNIDISELVGSSLLRQSDETPSVSPVSELSPSSVDSRLLALIESQQRTIEKQASTIENLSKK